MWTTPLGFPVLPEVYSRNSVSSLSRGSGGHSADSFAMACTREMGGEGEGREVPGEGQLALGLCRITLICST